MTDIVERLRFDAARCELQYSKGVAGNIEDAADEIERLRALDRERVAAIADLGATLERVTAERDAARTALEAYVRAVMREDLAHATYEQSEGGEK